MGTLIRPRRNEFLCSLIMNVLLFSISEIVLRSEYESGTRKFTGFCATRKWNINIYNNDEIAWSRRAQNQELASNSKINSNKSNSRCRFDDENKMFHRLCGIKFHFIF